MRNGAQVNKHARIDGVGKERPALCPAFGLALPQEAAILALEPSALGTPRHSAPQRRNASSPRALMPHEMKTRSWGNAERTATVHSTLTLRDGGCTLGPHGAAREAGSKSLRQPSVECRAVTPTGCLRHVRNGIRNLLTVEPAAPTGSRSTGPTPRSRLIKTEGGTSGALLVALPEWPEW